MTPLSHSTLDAFTGHIQLSTRPSAYRRKCHGSARPMNIAWAHEHGRHARQTSKRTLQEQNAPARVPDWLPQCGSATARALRPQKPAHLEVILLATGRSEGGTARARATHATGVAAKQVGKTGWECGAAKTRKQCTDVSRRNWAGLPTNPHLIAARSRSA